MKKLLAILMALLLPLGAMAETYTFTFDLQTGGDAFLQFVQEALLEDGAEETADPVESAKVLQSLLDDLGMDLAVQEDAFALELRVAGYRLLDLTGYIEGQDVLLTSDMFPGYVLTATQEKTREEAMLEQIDWVGAMLSVLPAVNEWCNALESTEAYGLFVGDAYDGGVKCTTWMFDDQAVAELVTGLLTEDVRAAMMVILASVELDGADVLRQLEERTEQVAQDNLYTYLLRWVQDDQNQTVGLSLTILAESEQIATVSIGGLDDGLRVVLGLGLQQQNYWNETIIRGDNENDVFQMTFNSREWAAAKDEAFAYVCVAKEPETDFEGRLTSQGDAWQLSMKQNGKRLLLAEGLLDTQTGMMNGTVMIGPENAQLASISFAVGQTDAIPAMDAALTKVYMTDPADAELAEKVMQQMAASMMARLIKVLPLQMILEMNPITLP